MVAKVLNNLESVGDMIGALKGIEDGLDEDAYMERIIKNAHNHAKHAFDIAAGSAGQAGVLKHVYEFGTAGITEGPPKFHDPTHPSARLWVHTIQGYGGNQKIWYTFRPAVNRNPQPTTASTGVPSKYLRKLSKRKYVFWNKALVMETGKHVKIRGRQPHGLLFVPTPGNNAPRNYMMWNSRRHGPLITEPGRMVQGNFTAFWMGWWGAQGGQIIENEMRQAVTEDTRLAMIEAQRRAADNKPKPVQAVNIPSSVSKARAFFRRTFGNKRRVGDL